MILPNGQDPDDFVRANGGEALRELLDNSIPLMDFVFGKLEEESDISTPGGRAKAMRSALELIYPLRASYIYLHPGRPRQGDAFGPRAHLSVACELHDR